jgi:CRP-like cAMP-binding protein
MTLFDVVPFRFLDAEARRRLAPHLTEREYAAGEVLFRLGETDDDRVFAVLTGTVELTDPRKNPPGRVGVFDAPHFFGERTSILGIPRSGDAVVIAPARIVAMPGSVMRALVLDNPAFAQAVGSRMRDRQRLFEPFERFLAAIRHESSRGHIVIARLLPIYQDLRPALHRGLAGPGIDFDALSYAVRRLPDNITGTFTLFATDIVPWLYTAADQAFIPMDTAARRRTAYAMMPGKSLIMLRDGLSDLVDLVTCLCMFAVEARKIRKRLRDPRQLVALGSGDEAVVDTLPFSAEEFRRIRKVWPADPIGRLREIAIHHEDFNLHVDRSSNEAVNPHAEGWTRQVAQATRQLLGVEPCDLADDFPVHIVSSNTHSVGNCLSSWLVDRADAIRRWGREHAPDDGAWANPHDQVMALSRAYFAAHPHEAARRAEVDEGDGVVHLAGAAFTGIDVQLFDLAKMAARPRIDPGVARPTAARGLLVNIDYAFGQQAEPIIANLIALFGPHIRSINVLGKAGGLVGARGDVLVASRFVEQDDTLQPLPRHVDVARLRARIPNRGVWEGPVLTVLGTVLQNDLLLRYYQRIWGCIGLEMEGSWFARQAIERRAIGVLRDDVALRFVYYVSDLPLEVGHSLTASMEADEGIPPLYAITRELLTAIFADLATAETKNPPNETFGGSSV